MVRPIEAEGVMRTETSEVQTNSAELDTRIKQERTRKAGHSGLTSTYRSGVPGEWFVDPVDLGMPGIRRPDTARNRYNEDDDPNDPLAWQTDALCAQTDPEAFFPEKGGSTRDAKRICASCDVRDECLDYALQNNERFGIWGGLSERERRKLEKRIS